MPLIVSPNQELGVNATPHSARTPTPVTFTAPLRAATRFGPENNIFALSGSNTATAANGAPVLGSINARAIELNTPAMPASGDVTYAFLFRTAAASSVGSRVENILGVVGQSATGGSGGQFALRTPSLVTGSNTTGQTRDLVDAGRILPRRAGTGWQWWPQTTLGAALTTIQLDPDTSYLCVLGIGGVRPQLIMVDIATGVAQSATGPTDITGTRPNAALFNLLGAVGSGTDRQGFGGDAAEFVVVHGGTFPTTAQAQAAVGDPASLASAIGGTLAYHNRLDFAAASGSTLASVVGSNATVTSGAIGLEPVSAFKTTGVVLDRLGSQWVFPFAPGAATGKAWFEGSAPAGATVVCYLRYPGTGTTSAQVRVTADGAGRFVASIDTPKATPFYRSAGNLADLADCHHEMDLMDIGMVVPMIGQSEMMIMASSAWTSTTDLTPVAANNSGLSATAGPQGATARWGVVMDAASRSTTGLGPARAVGPVKVRPERMLGRGLWADGVHEIAARIIADTGCSVMFAGFARGGHTVDQFIFDRRSFSQSLTLTGSGTGPYTATVALTTAAIQAAFADELGSTDAAALSLSSVYRNQVRPGTFSLDLGGGIVITDTRVSDASGTLAGPGGITGTITYVAGSATGSASISLTFPSVPAATTGTLTWQPKAEMLGAAANNKTANLDGFGVIETVDAVATLGLRYGWSVGLLWWATANLTDGANNAAIRANVAAKHAAMRNRLKTYVRSGVDASLADAPIMYAAKGRDTANTTTVDNARQLAIDVWASRPWARRGGHYHDFAVDVASSPHQTFGETSGKRIGRRMGAYLAAIANNAPLAEPIFRSGPADRTSDTVLTVPLASIAAGRTLAVSSGGNANALDQWYVGGVLVANDASTIARIRADGLAVELVKLSGTWAVGAEANVLYVSGAPGSGTAPPASLLYDNSGGFGGNEAGLLAQPKLA